MASCLSPQVVKITGLEGPVLGQEFSIKWNLPVSDLEKFDCYPEGPTASEETCRQRGCLWEVSAVSRWPQRAGRCESPPSGAPRKQFPNDAGSNRNHSFGRKWHWFNGCSILTTLSDRWSVFSSDTLNQKKLTAALTLCFLQRHYFKPTVTVTIATTHCALSTLSDYF